MMDKESEASNLLNAYKMMMAARFILVTQIGLTTHNDLIDMDLRHACERMEKYIKEEYPEAWEEYHKK